MIEVIHGDALDFDARTLATFQVQISDPPYSPNVHEDATSNNRGVVGVVSRDLGFEPLTDELRNQLAFAASCVSRWSLIFSDLEGCHLWRDAADAAGAEYVRTVPWIRWSQPQLSGDRPPTVAEYVNVFHAMRHGTRGGRSPLAKHWNGPGSFEGGYFSRRCMRGKEKHATEKPLDLMLDAVCYYSDPDDAVIDLTGGRGTTAVAARLLDRHCVAVELDKREAKLALERATGPLSARDRNRAEEWCVSVHEEASRVPLPVKDDESDVRTWERAQRRLADVARVMGAL
jgi:hypothetical protein